jgi:pimeloyl-ACP methyl ester carboxylesterase/protein-tyrosine phosphatase
LLVCIHGLGGSVAQFYPLLSSLTNLSACLAIDLPGCGRSQFAPTSWDAYSQEALVELWETVIDQYLEKNAGQKVVLVAHSMGCSLAAALASKLTTHKMKLAENVVALVGICPTLPPPEDKAAAFRKLLYLPTPVFDLWRSWDRRGGLESASVKRFVGAEADLEAKRLQLRFNNQSRSAVFRRMAWGTLPINKDGKAEGGMAGEDIWASLDIPVFLIGGQDDKVTPAAEVQRVMKALEKRQALSDGSGNSAQSTIPDSAAPVNTDVIDGAPAGKTQKAKPDTIDDLKDADFEADKRLHNPDDVHEDPSTPVEQLNDIPPQPIHPKRVLKSTILPSPANHALLYTPTTARIVAGLVSDFLACRITGRLSLGWQLQYLSREGKWDVKNLAKWSGVKPVSEPIAGIFRAMKTLREVDDVHCPEVFAQNWSYTIKDVVDISHDDPVYDPRGLERAGIHYHKFPTVSKIPPTDAEVEHFVGLIDRLREQQRKRADEEGWKDDYVIGVHCHYGFNRTGYFIVCYLVDREGYGVQQAIDEFARARPKGIKHSHFLDHLFMRYSGLGKDEED